MAVLKHIKSRNADYSAAIDYLLFQHDENCDPMSFDKECQITNSRFHKNQNQKNMNDKSNFQKKKELSHDTRRIQRSI